MMSPYPRLAKSYPIKIESEPLPSSGRLKQISERGTELTICRGARGMISSQFCLVGMAHNGMWGWTHSRERGARGGAVHSIRSRRRTAPGSILVFDGAGVPINFQPLHKRVVDGDDVGGNGPIFGSDVSDLEPLVVEAIELHREIAAHVIDQ
jgi:hypothetical protein